MSPKANKRFTPSKSMVARRQSWLRFKPGDPKLNDIGRALVRAAHKSQEDFDQLARELVPECEDNP